MGGQTVGKLRIYANANDYHSLYRKNTNDGTEKKLSEGHFFYEMNLYNDEIYYTASYPGEVWKISVDGSVKKKLINQKAGNLILYDNHMYYRLSEDNDWGKLFRADLKGNNRELLADKVKSFCIYNDLIYYIDIYNNIALCSMNTDGTNITTINNSYANNIIVENNMLIYSDHNRDDQLYVYDIERSKDKCWDLNSNKDWIFYRNQSDGGSLYCISFDGSVKHKLEEGNITDILLIDDIIFYRNIDKDNQMEYFDFKNKVKY